MLIERVFAGLALAVCGVLLARLLIGERRRWRFDAAVRRTWRGVDRSTRSMFGKIDSAWRWRSSRRHAAKVAEEAIRRARSGARAEGEWDGNVYKPKSFRKPPGDSKPPRDKMH